MNHREMRRRSRGQRQHAGRARREPAVFGRKGFGEAERGREKHKQNQAKGKARCVNEGNREVHTEASCFRGPERKKMTTGRKKWKGQR